ncbi:MAG: hypothetical protein Q8Q89_03370 [bacterium]|nr:hypothetical protein [bacterium]
MRNRKLLLLISATFLMSFLFFLPVYADTLGQPERFFVNEKFDKFSRSQLNATLRQISGKLYFYTEDSYWNNLDFARQQILMNNMLGLANEFEANIYPKEVSLWGSEPNPGIDGDPRVTILLEELKKNNGGYFDTVNGYSQKEASNTNVREMISLNIDSLISDPTLTKVFLAHEFHHLISFNQKDLLKKVAEDVWLNELRAEYSVSLIGYDKPYISSNLKRRFDLFLENPSDSLTEWPNTLTDYAIINAFGNYLVEQYGSTVLSETLRNVKTIGIPSINEYLALKGYKERFEDIFGYWMAAMYLNDINKNNRLGYLDPDLQYVHVVPEQQTYLSNGLLDTSVFRFIKPWQPMWLEFDLSNFKDDLSKSMKLTVLGETGKIFPVSYLVVYNDGTVEVNKLQINNGSGSVFIISSDKFPRKVIVMPTNATKVSDFGSSETSSSVRIDVKVVPTEEAKASIVKDGSLIKRKGESEIYVIWGKYKRYLNSGVISLYGHLDALKAIELDPEVFHSYTTANYVKYVDDEKVYAVWPDNTKHWMNITPRQWDDSGRDWEAIFTINDLELNYYKNGTDIVR